MNMSKVKQFVVVYCVVMLMFFAFEILPLNVGSQQSKWSDIPGHIRHRLPIMLVIGAAASAYIVLGKQNKTKK